MSRPPNSIPDTRAMTLPLRFVAWSAGLAAIALTHWLMLDALAIPRMCALIVVMLFWMKLVVLTENKIVGKPFPPLRRLVAWITLWPGMRLAAVVRTPSSVHSHAANARRGRTYAAGALINALAGFGLISLGLWIGGETRYVARSWAFLAVGTPLILAGMSLVLHYGLFHLVTAGWRLAGFNLGPLFRNPFGARSLDDFWTRRWNLAYVEMCQETVMRTTRSWPGGAKRIVVFAFSGLLHEVAISLSVMGGFGLPTLYFIINGAAMHLEGKLFRKGSIAARAWAFAWVIAPLPLLFHPWFLQDIILPLVGIRMRLL